MAHLSAEMIVIAVKDVFVTRALVLRGLAVLKTMTAPMVPSAKALRVYRVSAAMTSIAVSVRSDQLAVELGVHVRFPFGHGNGRGYDDAIVLPGSDRGGEHGSRSGCGEGQG